MARLLTVCPYKLLPLRGGGALRCFHLLRQLARFHEIHAIIFQRETELRQETEGYKVPDSVRIYSPIDRPPLASFFDKLPRRLGPGLQYRWLRRSWRGPADGVLLRAHHLIRQILHDYPIDIAIFEHLSSMMAAPVVRGLAPNAVRVLDAHNIDHKLMAADEDRRTRNSILWHETNLSRFVDAFFACSDDDKTELEKLNQHAVRGFTIPNGVDAEARPFDSSPGKSRIKELLFCGSLGYQANREGLLWFHRDVWPIIRAKQPDTRMTVIGCGGKRDDFASLCADGSVDFIGEVETVEPFYRQTGLAIVPLISGSGTRLKILEAMSFGNPVVSTRIGAEGIKATNGEHILLADAPHEFAQAVLRLLSEPELFNRLRSSARALVEAQYDWPVIGRHLNTAINSLIDQRKQSSGLVVGRRSPSAPI